MQIKTRKSRKMSTRKRIGMAILFAGLSSAFLSGCTTHMPSYEPTILRNKITVAETVERLELYSGPAGLHLSARDEDAVAAFLSSYAENGQGPLYINVPAATAQSPGVSQATNVIRRYLGRIGMNGNVVQSGQYPSAPGAPAPVIVSYRRLAAAPINCQQGAQLTHTGNNQPYGNFGCAQTANLAALIDNPMQLITPYGFDRASAVRRMVVIDKYNEGTSTSSERPDGQEVSAGGAGGGG